MEANFHLPDFTYKYNLNIMTIVYLRQFPERFREGVRIASVYGDFPFSLWNGGRGELRTCEERFMRQVVDSFNSLGVPIRYTFSNPLIGKEHLSDKHCNLLLDIANNGMNEVIVVSPILEEYVRNKYPNFKIISSTCKEIKNFGKLQEELEKDYKLVVLDYNWNNKFDELEKIEKKDKCEFLVNACCVPNCQRRTEHYLSIGKNALIYSEALKNKTEPQKIPFICKDSSNNYYQYCKFSTFITPDSIWEKYLPMGFSNFKIEGRTSNFFNTLESYVNFLIKPEFRDEVRHEWILALMDKNVIKIA
jgi:collagenase-like PrtC family protease